MNANVKHDFADDDSDIQESVERFVDTPKLTLRDVGLTPGTEIIHNQDMQRLGSGFDNIHSTSGRVVPQHKEGVPIKLDSNCLAHQVKGTDVYMTQKLFKVACLAYEPSKVQYRDLVLDRTKLIEVRRLLVDRVSSLLPRCDLFKDRAAYPRRYFDDLMAMSEHISPRADARSKNVLPDIVLRPLKSPAKKDIWGSREGSAEGDLSSIDNQSSMRPVLPNNPSLAFFDSREKLNMTEIRNDLTHHMSDLTPTARRMPYTRKRYGRNDTSEASTSKQSKPANLAADDILFSTKNSSKKSIFHRRNLSLAQNAGSMQQHNSLLRIENQGSTFGLHKPTVPSIHLNKSHASNKLAHGMPSGPLKPKVSFEID